MKVNRKILRGMCLFFGLFLLLKVYALPQSVWSRDSKYYEKLANFPLPLQDTIKLKKVLASLLDEKKNDEQALYYGLMAKGHSDFLDTFNSKSNESFHLSIKKAIASADASLIVWTHFNYCKYLYYYRKMDLLTPVLLHTIDLANKMEANKLILPGETYKVFGWIMLTVGDDELALQFLQKALLYTNEDSQEYGAILNAIGNGYLKKGAIDKSAVYFDKTVTAALRINDVVRYAKALGDKALVAEKRGDLIKAVSLLKEDIVLSKNSGADKNYMYASILLSKILLKQGEFTIAKVFLDSAEQVALTKTYYADSLRQIIELKMLIADNQNSQSQQLLHKQLKKIEESLKYTDGSSALHRSKWMIQKAKHELKVNDSNWINGNNSQITGLYVVGFLLLTILVFGLYFKFKK